MFKRILVVMVVIAMLFTTTVGAHAQAYETGVFINGHELTPSELMPFEYFLGNVQPGYYWLDQYGNFGVVGYGYGVNLYDLMAQSNPTGPSAYVPPPAPDYSGGSEQYYTGPFGTIGGSGSDQYYYDNETGCSVMDGSVSC